MKKVLITVALFAVTAQAKNIIHYDQNGKPETTVFKPVQPINYICAVN